MGIVIPQVVAEDRASGAQVIDGSLQFDSSNDEDVRRTPGSASNRKTWTWSSWVKRASTGSTYAMFGSGTGSNDLDAIDFNGERFRYTRSTSGSFLDVKTNALYRDLSAWYHVVCAVDTTQATSSNRVKLYVNGVQQTSLNAANYPGENEDTFFNSTEPQVIGKRSSHQTNSFDGRMSQAYFIDGQQLGPENFGFTDGLTGTWRPKKYTGDFNVGTSSLTVYPAPYSAAARFSSSADFGTVNNNATGAPSFPVGSDSHYGGKTIDLSSGGFKVTTVNSATTDFFMGMWVHFDTYETNRQFGINLNDNYVYFETGSGGAVKIRHKGDGGNTGSATNLDDGGWHHVALSRTGNTLYGFVDGTAVSSDSGGTSGVNTVLTNCDWWFWGGSGTSYNIDGQVFDPFVYIGQGVSSYTTPTAPLIDASGNINHFSGFSDTQAYYISPGVDVSGSSPNPVSNYFVTGVNSFYLPFDGNSPIGQDKSGNGNNWTPVNFGGSNSLDKATGALPILNTVSGGNYATVGVRTDDLSSNLKLAVDHAGTATDRTNAINGNTNLMTSFSANNSTYAYPTDASGSPYGKALYISGTGDYPRINYTAGDFNFMHNQDDSGTVEFWFYNGAYSTEGYLFANVGESSQVGLTIPMGSATTFNCYIQRGVGGGSQNAGTSTLPQNKWSHIAVTKQKVGSNVELKVYVNGVNTASNTSITATDLSNSNSAQTYWQTGSPIGHESSRGFTNAYISDIRIYNTVKYTSDFVVPSTSPDILPDTPSGVSGGSKLAKIIDGAVAFDGSGDQLEVTGPGTLAASSNWCAEVTIYCNSSDSTGTYRIISANEGTNSGEYWMIRYRNGKIVFHSGNNYDNTSTDTIMNSWVHLAMTKSGNTVRGFVDGKKVWENTSDTSATTITTLVLGGGYGSENWPGFISNARFVNGSSVYTADFTPPTAPLTNITNTYLLCCQSNTSATAAAVTPGTIINSISSFKENTSSTNQTWDNSSAASSTSSALGPDKLFWSDLGSAKSINKVTFDVIASGQSGDTSTNFVIYHSTSTSSTGNSVCGSGCNQITTPITTGTSPGTYSVTINFPAAVSARYVAITNGSGGSGGTYVFSNVSIEPNATATIFNPFNTDIHTVRGQETGYATWNPLDKSTNATLSDGNLNFKSSSSWSESKSTIKIPTTGKWYVEQIYRGGSSNLSPSTWNARYSFFGVCTNNYVFGNAGGDNCLVLSDTNFISKFGTQTAALGAVTKGPGGTVSLALNRDDNTYEFFYQGVSIDSGTIGTTDSELFFMVGHYPGNTTSFDFNFGQKPFKFPPPDGFQPLNGANIRPETVISRPDQFVGVATYTSNNNTLSVSDYQFQPDLLIFKNRDTANHWGWFDSVRGANKQLSSNRTNAESTTSGDGYGTGTMNSFDRNGFTLGNDVGSNVTNYPSGDGHVVYGFNAGGNKNTFNKDDVGYASAAAAGLTGGTITPTGASVGTKQGFSIIKYTGNSTANATLPHGLSEAPKFVIIKNLSNSYGWTVLHTDVGTTGTTLDGSPEYYMMDLTSTERANFSQDTIWNPTSTTVKIDQSGGANWVNNSNSEYIAYLWHDVPGLQKFGSYAGSSGTTFVNLGFRPALLVIKFYDGTDVGSHAGWKVIDNQRNKFNISGIMQKVAWDVNEAENGGTTISTSEGKVDFLSNGFRILDNHSPFNTSGRSYIYMAWAEAPASNLYGGQSNAR